MHFSGVQVLGWTGANYFANVSSVEFLYFDDFTDISIIHFFLIVIADLHHLISQMKTTPKAHQGSWRRIEVLLKGLIEIFAPDKTSFHGR